MIKQKAIGFKVIEFVKLCLFPLLLAGFSVSASAQETTTYKYDALGRVIEATKTGGPEAGVRTSLGYDSAGNRTSVTAENSPSGSGLNHDGASLPPPLARRIKYTFNGRFFVSFKRSVN